MGDYEKRSNICVIKIPEREEWEGEAEYILKEIITENFSNLEKGINLQIQKSEQTPNRKTPKKSTQRHMLVFQKLKMKKKILKVAK